MSIDENARALRRIAGLHPFDDDEIIARVHAINAHTLSKANDATFIGPTVRSFFVPDPQGFWVEFMDHGVKKDPNAK